MARLCNNEYVDAVSKEIGIALPNPWSTVLKIKKYTSHIADEGRCFRNQLPSDASKNISLNGIGKVCGKGSLAFAKMEKPVWEDAQAQVGDLDGIEVIVIDIRVDYADTSNPLFCEFERIASKTGFHRAVAKCDGDRVVCVFLKRPAVTMQTLGANGRWANQLIQYLWLRVMGERHGLVVQCPAWHGSPIFGLATTPPSESVAWEINNSDHRENVYRLAEDESVKVTQNYDFWGWWQNGFDDYANPWREFAKRLFTPVSCISSEMEAIWSKINSRSENIVGSHLRRGDYSHCGPGWGFHPTPFRWHDKWIVDNVSAPCAAYIASEDASAIVVKPWSVRTTHVVENSHLPRSADWLVDFEMLKRCNTICMSNSTYSYMAGWLGSASKVVRPSLSSWGMVEETFEGKKSMLDWTAPDAEQWNMLIAEDI